MKRSLTQGEQNLLLLEKLFPVNDKFYIWCYAPDGHCIATSCPEQEKVLLDQAFRLLGGHDKAEQYCKSSQSDRPMIIGSSLGMQWALTMETDRNLQLLFVIGSVFYSIPRTEELKNALQPYLLDFRSSRILTPAAGKQGDILVALHLRDDRRDLVGILLFVVEL